MSGFSQLFTTFQAGIEETCRAECTNSSWGERGERDSLSVVSCNAIITCDQMRLAGARYKPTNWNRACTLQQICGSFPQLALAPKLVSAVGWGAWTSEQHVNTLSSSLTVCHTSSEPFNLLKLPLSQKGQEILVNSSPSFPLTHCDFAFEAQPVWICPCPLMKPVTDLFSSDTVSKLISISTVWKNAITILQPLKFLAFVIKLTFLCLNIFSPSLNKWHLCIRKTQKCI